jgi:arginine utilization regulatory protein
MLLIPDLKERKEDIPLLLDFFIKKYNKEKNKFIKRVSDEVIKIFMEYDWPGNVRELEHTIEGITSIYDVDILREEHLPYQFKSLKSSPNQIIVDEIKPMKEALLETEKKLIISALKNTNNNISKAAKLLKLPRQTLQYRIKKLGI